MPKNSRLVARLGGVLPRKLSTLTIPSNVPYGAPLTIIPGAADDSPSWMPITPNLNPVTGIAPPVTGGPTIYGPPSLSGTFGGPGTGGPQVGGFWGNVLTGNTSPSSQGVDPSQIPGGPDQSPIPSAGKGWSSPPGDYPETSGPENQAGNQDDPNQETPDNTEGPSAYAYNPEGDYGRGGLPPGVIIGGPGIASYDPEGGGSGSGSSGRSGFPGLRNPRGTAGTPNPEGGGPVGPAARSPTQSTAGTVSLSRSSGSAWLTGLTSTIRSNRG